MVVTDNRQQGHGEGTGAGSERTATAGRAEDLRGFLQQLSDQFADADRRHSESLRDMRERLARLGDQTGSLKQTMPKGFEADLERLEAGMVQLAQRIAEAEQPRNKDEHGLAVGSTADSEMPAAEGEHVFDAGDASRAEARPALVAPPPALKSAVTGAAGANWARNEEAAPQPPPPHRGDEEPWDKTSADALAHLYDSGEAGMPKLRHPLDLDEVRPAGLQPANVTASPSATGTALPLAAMAPGSQGAADSGHGVARSEADRLWLESQLGDIASRVERSLAEFKPDNSMSDLSRRFEQFEDRWNTAMADIATRSDVEGLRIVEAHITELTERLDQAQAQLARLDAIETQLADIAGQLTDDQIVRLFGGLVPTEEDLSRFAEAAAEKAAARVAADLPAPAAGLEQHAVAQQPVSLTIPPSIEANQIESNERIQQLQTMLSGFINERRQSSVETSEALETMQHAMQHVLDRIDSLEATTLAPPPAPQQSTQAQLADVATQLEQSLPSAAVRNPAPQPGPAQQDDFETVKAAAKAAAAAAGRGVPGGQNSKLRSQYAAGPRSMSEPSLDASAAELAGDVEFADGRQRIARGGAPAGGRNPVLDDARRKLEKARIAGAASEQAEPEPSSNGGLRGKFLGGKDASGEAGGKAAGVRPGILVAVCCGLLLFASFWLLVGSKNRMLGLSPQFEQSSGATKGNRETSSKAAPAVTEEEPEAAAGKESAGGTQSGEMPEKPIDPAPSKRPKADERSEAPSAVAPLRQAADTSMEGKGVAGTVMSGGPGIAVQHSGSTQTDIERVREQMRIAALSHRTAQNVAQASATSSPAVPASIMKAETSSDASAEALPAGHKAPQVDSKTVLELPPALVGPLSLRLAAAKGDPSAQFEIAARFAEGKGIKQDFGQAAAWYQRAANQGQPNAQYRLAALYERGLGVKADTERARVWYKRAAEQGNVKAMHNLAVLSAGRDQGAADYPTAVQWFTEAAERGLADSQYNLGVLHESGLGVPKNAAAAYKWYALAAKSGDREASRRHAALRGKLDAIALQAAEEGVAAWRPRPIESASNDSFAAGSAWKTRAAGNQD